MCLTSLQILTAPWGITIKTPPPPRLAEWKPEAARLSEGTKALWALTYEVSHEGRATASKDHAHRQQTGGAGDVEEQKGQMRLRVSLTKSWEWRLKDSFPCGKRLEQHGSLAPWVCLPCTEQPCGEGARAEDRSPAVMARD